MKSYTLLKKISWNGMHEKRLHNNLEKAKSNIPNYCEDDELLFNTWFITVEMEKK